jgi:hypothetical protein
VVEVCPQSSKGITEGPGDAGHRAPRKSGGPAHVHRAARPPVDVARVALLAFAPGVGACAGVPIPVITGLLRQPEQGYIAVRGPACADHPPVHVDASRVRAPPASLAAEVDRSGDLAPGIDSPQGWPIAARADDPHRAIRCRTRDAGDTRTCARGQPPSAAGGPRPAQHGPRRSRTHSSVTRALSGRSDGSWRRRAVSAAAGMLNVNSTPGASGNHTATRPGPNGSAHSWP